ncbi:T9SS type A sorting domain-containing protein [Bacteroidota bacterium]
MKKLYFLFFSIALSLSICSIDSMAQSYIDVDPGVGTLNDAITAHGGSKIYRLKRGDQALYFLTGSISNSGYHLTIVAEEGTGARPFLQPKTPDGGLSSRPFTPKGDLTIKGLHVTGIDDLGGNPAQRIISCKADGIRVEIEDCWLDGDTQSAIRVNNTGMSFIIKNSIISNIGHPSSPNNGRGIDDRSQDIDTVIMEGCTFFNITSRIIRDDGGWIKYCRFKNNTAVNIGQFGVSFGEVGYLDMKDNLFMNAGFFPDNSIDDPRYIVGFENIGKELINMGFTQEVNISNNSFWRDTAQMHPYLSDDAGLTLLFNEYAMEFVTAGGTEATILDEMVEFADGPPFADSVLYYNFTPGVDPLKAPFWELPPIPGGKFWHTVMYYDLDYKGIETVTGASDGKHLGDPRWDATLKDVTSVRDLNRNTSGLSVYPVPVDMQANISFTLMRDANVDIAVFNIVGKRVATIEQSRYPAGTHTLTWNRKMLDPGMYMLRMNTGNKVNTVKILMK